jgi:hypothetical protein
MLIASPMMDDFTIFLHQGILLAAQQAYNQWRFTFATSSVLPALPSVDKDQL